MTNKLAWPWLVAAVPFLVWAAWTPARTGPLSALPPQAVVLADPADPYFTLAEEISQAEGLPIAHTLDEAVARQPVFLLWVASPSFLLDRALVDYGQTMRGRGSSISAGILSGSSMEEARRLWLRAAQVQGETAVAANAANPSAHVEAGITTHRPAGTTVEPLTKANLVSSLVQADYLTFTGHGSPQYLRLDASTTLAAADVPPLRPAVIASGNCNSFRLWETDSLPLAFVGQGAAGFAGFAYSPIEGYLLGQYAGLPFRYTWPDYPVGHAMQVQNHAALQGFARLPYLHLLGDPRLSLQAAPPYRLVDDRVESGVRTLTLSGAPAGAIPVHVPDGAGYTWVEVPGVSAAWEGDPFYNSRLQMADIGEDKLLLVLHPGGDMTVRLEQKPRWTWVAGDVLLDALDNALLFMPQTGGAWLMVAAAVPVLIAMGWGVARGWGRRRTIAVATAALLIGAGLAAAHGLYALARLDRVTMISKPVDLSPEALVATLLWVAIGAFLYLNAKSWRGRAIAVAVAALPAIAPALLNLGMATLGNWALGQRLGVSLYNGHLGLQAGIAAAAECLLLAIVLAGVGRRWDNKAPRVRFAGRRDNLSKGKAVEP